MPENDIIIGCDSTNVNVGWKNGINRNIELYLIRPLFVCILHTNELLLRHLFQHLDGKTSGPSSFSGDIGSKLKKCEVEFENISLDESLSQKKCRTDLSQDQKLLYYYCELVSTGETDIKFVGQTNWSIKSRTLVDIGYKNPSSVCVHC